MIALWLSLVGQADSLCFTDGQKLVAEHVSDGLADTTWRIGDAAIVVPRGSLLPDCAAARNRWDFGEDLKWVGFGDGQHLYATPTDDDPRTELQLLDGALLWVDSDAIQLSPMPDHLLEVLESQRQETDRLPTDEVEERRSYARPVLIGILMAAGTGVLVYGLYSVTQNSWDMRLGG